MKVKRFMLATLIATSVTSSLMVGCTPSSPDIDKKTYTVEEISDLKKDLSKRISKAISKSGLRVVEAYSDGSFVLSLGNLELTKNQPKQVLNYSMTKDEKENKEILSIHCVKDFLTDEKLSENDKFVRAIYKIYESLTEIKLTEKEFFDEIKKVFNAGEGNVEIANMGDIIIRINKIDKSTKTLELKVQKEFVIK